ncbi:MAG: Gfo/Idh/MocA family oxidoreductase [Planctomycetota bacterium]
MSAPPLHVGVIGYGFMGRTHAEAYTAAGAERVTVFDPGAHVAQPDAAGGGDLRLGGIGSARAASLEEFLSIDSLVAVSVCTPTDTHIELATAALEAGKHVLVEKPVALDVEQIEALAAAADLAGRLCVPAMCMRRWPAWQWLAEAIRAERYGPLRSARFERLGPTPGWNDAFYRDTARSGGAIFDLHIHDTDFITHLLGMPAAVRTTGTEQHLTTVYLYDDVAASVAATGGWIDAPGLPFRMRFFVECEAAALDFELGRTPELVVHHADGTTEHPPMPVETGWQRTVSAFIDSVQAGAPASATLTEAAGVTRLLHAERRSLRTGRDVGL